VQAEPKVRTAQQRRVVMGRQPRASQSHMAQPQAPRTVEVCAPQRALAWGPQERGQRWGRGIRASVGMGMGWAGMLSDGGGHSGFTPPPPPWLVGNGGARGAMERHQSTLLVVIVRFRFRSGHDW
jgi:hypothetical protein